MTGSPDPSRVRVAADLLSEGPLHTLDVARRVLGLEGHTGAAAAAVFQLLGADPRFRVDADGVWSVDDEAVPLGEPLGEVSFAVVDVETTGGSADRGHRVIDVAIVEVRGGEVVDEYQTLVNPARNVSSTIEGLTGISNDMVRGAPYFDHVADEISRRLRGRVFVAHNVSFDWRFIEAELLRAQVDVPEVPLMCTVRMSRRLVPDLRRRNLDVVARHFGVPIHERHRAYGDALATARVLLRLLDEARGRGIDDVRTLQWYLERRRRRLNRDPAQFALDLPGYPSKRRRS